MRVLPRCVGPNAERLGASAGATESKTSAPTAYRCFDFTDEKPRTAFPEDAGRRSGTKGQSRKEPFLMPITLSHGGRQRRRVRSVSFALEVANRVGIIDRH